MEKEIIEVFVFLRGRWHVLVIDHSKPNEGYDILIPVSEGAD
jgi:hypothetical protein